MRVLQVSHTAQPGGSNTVLLSLLRHAPPDVQCACVFLEDGPVLEQVRSLGTPVALVRSGRAREAWRAPGVLKRLRGAIRAHRARVVLSHVSKAHLYAGPAASLEQIPALWWQHEHPGIKPRLQRAAGRLPARAVICSAEWTAALQERLWPRAPVMVVHPGLEAEALAAPARKHAAGPVTIGVMGRLARWKRAHLAVGALPLIREQVPGVRLRLIGGAGTPDDAGYERELRAEAERLGMADAVELTGHMTDPGAAVRQLDVLVHPAEQEPWGIVVLEAMSAGVPVVAADEGGPREILRDGVDGRLVDPRDSEALALAVVELARDPGLRAHMGAEARERARTEFSAERAAAQAWAIVRGSVA